ncbi:hypothetical protein EYF80_016732 [Liparis tanakae]|uniref:Uncharacterized protein n=1 Tax=Liparis tanakae TaxID=230148 RepID=A0A4Z2I701_9TELE|nr:hypothetical protein EYF80_016732 [Liparis tanakae]
MRCGLRGVVQHIHQRPQSGRGHPPSMAASLAELMSEPGCAARSHLLPMQSESCGADVKPRDDGLTAVRLHLLHGLRGERLRSTTDTDTHAA